MNLFYPIKYMHNESFDALTQEFMRLTQWTDYTLRVLMYCAACRTREQPVTITEIAESHEISRSHLTKIVQQLGAIGLLETTRGRGGGMRLLKDARAINIGEVVRQTETDFTMVECFDPLLNQCGLSQQCKLKGLLHQATASYLAVLDGMTLEELVTPAVTQVSSQSRESPGRCWDCRRNRKCKRGAPKHDEAIPHSSCKSCKVVLGLRQILRL